MINNNIKFKLKIDPNNQWFVYAWVTMGNKKSRVEFKVDTGCNSLVISHRTLKNLGYSTKESDLSKLPGITGALASGDKHTFRKIGSVSLFQDKDNSVQICKADAVCHSTHETHDLLGTEIFRQFIGVNFCLTESKYMELTQK